MQTAESDLRTAMDGDTVSSFRRADLWLGPAAVLDKPRKSDDDYLTIWEAARTQFEATLGRLLPNSAVSQRPPFRISAAVTSKTFELPRATVGAPYAGQLVADGGAPAYTFTANPQAQSGLSMGPAGGLSGVPVGPARDIFFMVQVTDAQGQGASKVFKISLDTA